MLWLIGAAVAFIAIWPFAAERRLPMPDQTTGDFAQLSDGLTHYRWIGPDDGPVVVMVHGLTTPLIVFQTLAQGLARDGYRVLLYDLYGRGLSDCPKAPQTRAFFLRQLSQLLEDQKISDPIAVVGFSMGGAIGTCFAAAKPDRVKQLILLAPAGMTFNEGRFWWFCRTVPIVGDWAHALTARLILRTAVPDVLPTHSRHEIFAAQRAELNRRGYLPATLSSRRGMLSETLQNEHEAIAQSAVKVTAIWGENDQDIPLSAKDMLSKWNPSARHVVIADADHGLPYTHADEVLVAMKAALSCKK